MDGFVNETEWFFIPYMMVGMARAPLEVQQGPTQEEEGQHFKNSSDIRLK
jgi:hypothetical protein